MRINLFRQVQKILFFLIIFTFFPSLKSYSQNYIYFEFENRYTFSNEIDIRPKVSLYAESIKTDKKFGGYLYGQANNKWGEAYGGFVYKPLDWMCLYSGIGIEVDSIPYRANIGLILKNEKITFNQWYEYGGSGFWYSIKLNYKVSSSFKFGLISKRYYGTGIDLYYRFNKIPITLNLATVYDFEFDVFRTILILRFVFT